MNTFSKAKPAAAAGITVSEDMTAPGEFSRRHIGPDDAEIAGMLQTLGKASLEDLIRDTVPGAILRQEALQLDAALGEAAALQQLRRMMAGDKSGRSFIGQGYYDTRLPAVIQRNVLENPGWYTSYTPYQPEISQGRLNCLLNFQQMVMDLTGMEISNASLLDEATAAAEGMAMAKRVSSKADCNRFFVSRFCFPQTLDVVATRAAAHGYELVMDDPANLGQYDVFGALQQYPDSRGQVADLAPLVEVLHGQKALAVVACDLMSLLLLKPPGEMGADIVVGSTQRFGVPMGYGGPHAAYLATRDQYKRAIPGRMIGVSVDSNGKQALRMALQTREQHIRREKAKSNICTAQALLANISALYAMYHGPTGLKAIATRIHELTSKLATLMRASGHAAINTAWFDTLSFSFPLSQLAGIRARANAAGISLFIQADEESALVTMSLDECSEDSDPALLAGVLLGNVPEMDATIPGPESIPAGLARTSDYLTHPVFNTCHSETEMLRFLKRMENRDISLTHSMIPLGSCTMKLNASAEMLPITWPEISGVHPFTDPALVPGYQLMISELAEMLCEITGFDAMSMQPNSGAQGEYAGLLAIRHYLDSQGATDRNVCLIPSSAHGTNPASAQMVGMQVVIVACDSKGNIDLDSLRAKLAEHGDRLAAFMLTYPSTHGVFEEAVKEICRLVHDAGGQVYMDGANLNAQVGLSRPGDIGADVSHVNLHKTFCIPHGGGGPGMGPIGVKSHLIPFLPGHAVVKMGEGSQSGQSVSAAPWGSASILPISWMYIRMMGPQGLRKATAVAILNANYIAKRLSPHYQVLYTGRNDMVAHECIIDLRPFKASCDVTEVDVAKRLIDFGFHAPTMSFPVAGTLMIEPTESESKAELDRFIDAMIAIRKEITDIEAGTIGVEASPLRHAPHTLNDICADSWDRAYTRQQGAFPLPWLHEAKYWPPVNRVDNAYGDRHLVCSCPPPESYN